MRTPGYLKKLPLSLLKKRPKRVSLLPHVHYHLLCLVSLEGEFIGLTLCRHAADPVPYPDWGHPARIIFMYNNLKFKKTSGFLSAPSLIP